jgi:hypothetical protein
LSNNSPLKYLTRKLTCSADVAKFIVSGADKELWRIPDFEQQFSIEILDKKAYLLC